MLKLLRTAAALATLLLCLAGPAWAAPPIATDDSFTAVEFEPATFNVLTNDTDPDGDELTLESHTQSVEGGTVSCESNGDCTYNDVGGNPPYEDSFEYTVTDGTTTDTATVTITVEAAGGGNTSFDRAVTLRLEGELVAKGAITSSAAKCERDEPVKIQRKDEGGWVFVKKATTSSEGRFRVRIPHRFGRYRAMLEVRGDCNQDVSPTRSYLTNEPQTITDPDDVPGFLDIAKVRIDHDGFAMHFKWIAHDSWQLSSLTGGKRLGVYLLYGGGYYSIDVDMGEDLPIVPIVPCSGSPGSGQSCDNGSVQYGEGQKAGPKAMTFSLPLRFLDRWPNPGSWQGHSASNAGSGFDFTSKKSYRR